jgi:hypothetical protein
MTWSFTYTVKLKTKGVPEDSEIGGFHGGGRRDLPRFGGMY